MTVLTRLFNLFGAGQAQPPSAPPDPLEEERAVRAAAEASVASLDLPAALAALLELPSVQTQVEPNLEALRAVLTEAA